MKRIASKRNLTSLTSADTYTLILYAISILTGCKDYEITSKLFYALDGESFEHLVKLFGGRTIKIPTEEELIVFLSAIDIYVKVDNGSYTLKEALNECYSRDSVTEDKYPREKILMSYYVIRDVLKKVYNVDRC